MEISKEIGSKGYSFSDVNIFSVKFIRKNVARMFANRKMRPVEAIPGTGVE
jgi:hypothetical protein